MLRMLFYFFSVSFLYLSCTERTGSHVIGDLASPSSFTVSHDYINDGELGGPIEIAIRIEGQTPKNPFKPRMFSAHIKDSQSKRTIFGFTDSVDGSLYKLRFVPERFGNHHLDLDFIIGDTEYRIPYFMYVPVQQVQSNRVKISENDSSRFEYGNEKPLLIGNTYYGLLGLNESEIYLTLRKNKEQGFNRIRFLTQGALIDGEYGASFSKSWQGILNPFISKDFLVYDVEYFQKLDRIVNYMYERDMIASLILTIDRQGEFPSENSYEEYQYYQYIVNRYAAYGNVMFDLGNEHNEFRAVPDWADTLVPKLKNANGMNSLFSAHGYDQFLYPDSKWVGWQNIQAYGNSKELSLNVVEHLKNKKPVINEEFGYEEYIDSREVHRPDKILKRAWTILLSGGYFTYGNGLGDFVTGRLTTSTGSLFHSQAFNLMHEVHTEFDLGSFKLSHISDRLTISCDSSRTCIGYSDVKIAKIDLCSEIVSIRNPYTSEEIGPDDELYDFSKGVVFVCKS